MKKLLLASLFTAAFCGAAFAGNAPDAPGAPAPLITLQDHDVWVMAGDSITAGRMHTNYIEAFFRARHPELRLHFRNAGTNGATAQSMAPPRFDHDIAAWRPTIVSVELGMNDSGKPTSDVYIENMAKTAALIRGINARPLFISASPVNDGGMTGRLVRKNQSISLYTDDLKALGRRENIPVVDQFHPLVDLWGRNKIVEQASLLAKQVKLLQAAENHPEWETLQAMARLWDGKPDGLAITSVGDTIHPGGIGQYMMAAVILAGLNVDREVSSATINADGTLADARFCKITDLGLRNGRLAFTRLDARSPWPLARDARTAMQLMPEIADLSRHMLTVTGLAAGNHTVSMDGKVVATLTSEELAGGWNMGTLDTGPVNQRLMTVIRLVNQLQWDLNRAWRDASKAGDQARLAEAQKAIEACEEKLQAAVQPVAVRFEIAPAK
jgi:lysophospholipase L1-like esterase